jgi:hypothetical protein
MKKDVLTLDINQYDALRHILQCEHLILNKRRMLLSGTKQVPANLVVCSFLHDRNLMLYDTARTYEKYGTKKHFTLFLFQLSALSYYLSTCDDLPEQLKTLQVQIKRLIEPYEFETVKTAFQEYYERVMMPETEVSYTELRDEMPATYDYYFEQFNRFES